MGWGTQDTCEAQDIVILVAGHTEHSLSNKYHIGIYCLCQQEIKLQSRAKHCIALYFVSHCIVLFLVSHCIPLNFVSHCILYHFVLHCILLLYYIVHILYHILSHCILYFVSHCIALYLVVVSHCIACRESLRADLRVC